MITKKRGKDRKPRHPRTELTPTVCGQAWDLWRDMDTIQAAADHLGLSVRAFHLRISRFRQMHRMPPCARPVRTCWIDAWEAWGESRSLRKAAAAMRATGTPRYAKVNGDQVHRWAKRYIDAAGLPAGSLPYRAAA